MAHSQNTQQSVVCSSAPPFEHAAQLSHQKCVTGVVPERLGHCRHPLFESSTGLLRSCYKIGRRASFSFLYQYHFPNEYASRLSRKVQLTILIITIATNMSSPGTIRRETSHHPHIHSQGACYLSENEAPTLAYAEICPTRGEGSIKLTSVDASGWASQFPPNSGTTIFLGCGAKIHFPQLDATVESGASHRSRVTGGASTARGPPQHGEAEGHVHEDEGSRGDEQGEVARVQEIHDDETVGSVTGESTKASEEPMIN